MFKNLLSTCLGIAGLSLFLTACKTPALVVKNEHRNVPLSYDPAYVPDSANSGQLRWREFFTDPHLLALIDTALRNNQELNVTLQEIEIARNEIRARKGEYLPFVNLGGSAGLEKVGRYTLQGATEEANEIRPSRTNPAPLPNFLVGAFASWEVDIWHKLRNAKKAAVLRYGATVEGRNFLVTNLVAELANSYYELLALDNQLAIVRQNIDIQSNALAIVRLQKESARTTELAVRRFEAQVLHTQSLQYDIQQKIIETENRLNFLVGRYPQPIERSAPDFGTRTPAVLRAGLPSQLLQNRPDVRQAEQELAAAKVDVQVARANFYPALRLDAGLGFNAYNPTLLLNPESMLFALAGGLTGPWVNRNGIIAHYASSNARQTQAVYHYERTLLNAYTEVANQLAKIGNLEKSYDLKAKQVEALTQSVAISNTLFRSARADYMEVLLTQRDALESRFELVETRMQQFNAAVNAYRALGGGWK